MTYVYLSAFNILCYYYMERPKKKRCTRQSKVESTLPEGTKRTSTVSLSIKSHTSQNGKKHIELFDSISKRVGFYRRLTSLLANYIITRKIEQGLEHPEQDIELPEINCTFYDQVWASLAHKDNEWTPLCQEFIQVCHFNWDEFPQDVKTITKGSVTSEMAIVSKTMISGMFETKISSHVSAYLGNNSDYFQNLDKNSKRRDINMILKLVLDPEFESIRHLDLDKDYGKIINQLRHFLDQVFLEMKTSGKQMKYIVKSKSHLFLNMLSFINIEAEKEHVRFITTCKEFSKLDRKDFKNYIKENKLENRVKVSSLLPIFDLQPAFVYYSDTVIKAEFEGDIDIVDFIADTFVLDKVNMKKYVPYGFRTNGVELKISYMVLEDTRPYPKGTKELNKAGYQITNKTIDVVNQKRGLFKLYQSRSDAKKVIDPSKVNIKCVDPGCSSVVSVREASLSECGDPNNIIKNSKTWDLLGTEYSQMSGRNSGQTRESRRRRKCMAYMRSIRKFKNILRKTSRVDSIIKYCRVVAETLKDLYREKNRVSRRVFSMYQSRKQRSVIDKLSNKIAFDNSKKKKNVVLFGNGSFQSKQGHASCPRKDLVRSLASRCLVGMLDEFKTSKMCPGGCNSEMENTEENRMRQCTTDLIETPCCLSSENHNFVCDRDQSATINFCRIAYDSLLFKKWPDHLKRAK